MRKFLIKVNNQHFEVEVEEVKGQQGHAAAPAPKPAASAPAEPAKPASSSSHHGSAKITAPMPGNILKVDVKAGDVVKKGQTVLVLEAMKMENEIHAPADGKVLEVKVSKGQAVKSGEVLVTFE